jgi:hypothetical protein
MRSTLSTLPVLALNMRMVPAFAAMRLYPLRALLSILVGGAHSRSG